MHINTVTAHCADKIAQSCPILLILDIDDTVLASRDRQRLVDPQIRNLIKLAHDNPTHCKYIFCTARESAHHKLTLNQLNHAKLLHLGTFIPYIVLHSPYVVFGSNPNPQPTKGHTILSYLRGNDIDPVNTHIVVVDDDDEQIDHIHDHLSKTEYAGKYTLWHYIAAWAQHNQCWA